MGSLPVTYDLEVILKYCGRSSYDLQSQSHLDVVGGDSDDLLGLCGWSWLVLGASQAGSGPLWAVLAMQGAPRDAKTAPRGAKRGQERPQERPRASQERPKSGQEFYESKASVKLALSFK